MKKAGFTLIELLIVLLIIGALIRLSLVSYQNVLRSSRDARRKADLLQLRSALEQYRSINGNYPTSGGSYYGICTNGQSAWPTGCTANTDTGSCGYVPNLAPNFLQTLPHDPRESKSFAPCYDSNSSCYIYRSDGNDYKVFALCGVESQINNLCVSSPTTTDSYFDPVRHAVNNCAYQVSSSDTARSSW